jgi:CHAT domain-containing protein
LVWGVGMTDWPRHFVLLSFALTALLPAPRPSVAQSVSFVAPPRTVADIEAILNGQKPDAARIEKLRIAARAVLPADAEPIAQVTHHRARGFALSELGQYPQAVAELTQGIAAGETNGINVIRLRMELGYVYSFEGDNKAALRSLERAVEDLEKLKQFGGLPICYRWLAQIHIYLGDIPQAEEYVRKLEATIENYRISPQYNENALDAGRVQLEFAHGRVFDARGQFREAEQSYELANSLTPVLRTLAAAQPTDSANLNYLQTLIDNLTASAGRAKARQGRFAEGEADARRALLGRLNSVGKYNLTTARTLPYLSTILIEQGRYSEAEKLTRVTIDIYRTLGVALDSLAYAFNLSELGTILCLQEKWVEAAGVYAELDHAIEGWDQNRRADMLLTPARIYTLYNTGSVALGLSEAASMVRRLSQRVGEKHFDYALAKGILAIGLRKANRSAEAALEFRIAIPYLTRVAVQNDDDELNAAFRETFARRIIESYIELSARDSAGNDQASWTETFQLAEAVRARSVQKALLGSTVRGAAQDANLANLIRTEQDLEKQIHAELGLLNNVLSQPADESTKGIAAAVIETVTKLRDQRDRAGKELKQQFPDYADLIDPEPPTVASVRAILRNEESFLSFYVGHDQSFVWAIPKEGPVGFSIIPLSAVDIKTKVEKLREALESHAAMVSDIPAFDLELGYELYSLLLRPVEPSWKPTKNLIVVANGGLGLLPLSLLPTVPFKKVLDADPLFSTYRDVSWLARSHAVTTVPSAVAFRALRNLPGSRPDRNELIGFGDPYFNKNQQAQADASTTEVQLADTSSTTRGSPLRRRSSPKLEGLDSADLGMLPRLPDTADELKSIAAALRVDPSKAIHLGKQADERAVETTDLSVFKVIAFATHGLVPGELNGLTQPALALSSPDVTGSGGDGLLTLDEILALKLDADWVVLSACNTGAGAGAGAEAASGLGRAFFYAGTRALLVTNWSVQSQSARELVTDLFKRQAQDPQLSRGEALRQAMMALVDGPGYLNADGKTEFTYAHPLFWAPYSIIGDGGVR